MYVNVTFWTTLPSDRSRKYQEIGHKLQLELTMFGWKEGNQKCYNKERDSKKWNQLEMETWDAWRRKRKQVRWAECLNVWLGKPLRNNLGLAIRQKDTVVRIQRWGDRQMLSAARGMEKEACVGWSPLWTTKRTHPRAVSPQWPLSHLEPPVNHTTEGAQWCEQALPKALLPLSSLNLLPPWGCTQIAHIRKQIDCELSFVYQQFLICNLVMSERKSLIIQ